MKVRSFVTSGVVALAAFGSLGIATANAAPSAAAWGNGHHGGANAFFPGTSSDHAGGRIYSPDRAAALVDQVNAVGGGTLRIQVTGDELDNNSLSAWDSLQRAVTEGDKTGVKVQITLRYNGGGGGGTTLTGSGLQKGEKHIGQIVSKFKDNPSFVLDTFNEPGDYGSNENDWATMQVGLITAARNTGYTGPIAVEEDSRGTGFAGYGSGGHSGLADHAQQLQQANGASNPKLIGSFHIYSAGTQNSKELTVVNNAGFVPQVGEYGDANYVGSGGTDPSHQFTLRSGTVNAVKALAPALTAAGGTAFPWMDEFSNDTDKYSSIIHDYGYNPGQQVLS